MLTEVKNVSMVGGLMLLSALFCTCGQSSVVRVTRQAGITIDSSMVLAVGDISGDEAKVFRNEIRKALYANREFTLLREDHAQEAFTDSMWEAIAGSFAETNQTLVLITGRYKADSDTKHLERYVTKNGKTETEEYIEKTFTGRFSFQLLDPANHAILFSREIVESVSEEKEPNWLLNAIVDAIITDPHYTIVRGRVVDAFMYELHPHEESFNVTLFNDSEMPELGTGISYAQLGHWDKAIILFKSVPDKYPNNENIHKAYYDLGIAYKWSYMFSEARENLEKAYLLKNKSEYYDEIQRLASFEQEYKIRQNEGRQPTN